MTGSIIVRTLAFVGLIAASGCGRALTSTEVSRFANGDGSAVLRVETERGGGAAGYVLNWVSFEAGGKSLDRFRTLEHLSELRVLWLTDRRVLFCYVGSMDRGDPHWTGTLEGNTYEIDFLSRKIDQTCSAA